MEIFKQYDLFKEKCNDFSEKFEAKYFSGNKLICHPTVRNELISVCSDEEAHSNAIYICRMADMLLMSEDAEEWSSFNITEARSIAEQNGFIYLTDLLAEDAFLSEEWMINGKNDTIIVNEEYMREKGKRYAPVTPLTNRVLHFKKYSSGFFWKASAPGDVLCVNTEYIEKRYKEFFTECEELLPDLSESKTINFKLFGDDISIDVNVTRARTIELFFGSINDIMGVFAENTQILDIVGYKFDELDFILDITAAALRKNGIELSKEEFAGKYYSPALNSGDLEKRLSDLNGRCGKDDIDCVKLAFIDAVTAEYKDDISYSAEDSGFYNNKIRRLELGSYSDDEEKYLIEEIVSCKPEDYRIFYYTYKKYPEETENLNKVAEFWKITPVAEDEMENLILGAYILDESFDEQGRFCAGYDASCILKEQLEKVIAKYGISNRECIEELEQHIEMLDKERRTFGGTLFATPEEMKLAVKNEAYVQELCRDLSALNEKELADLRRHIEDTTLDDNTKSKYLVKIQLAENNVHVSMLEQSCLKLALMNIDEIAELKEKIITEDYPEAVAKPFIAKINDAYSSAQRTEIDAMLENSADLTDEQLDGIARRLISGRYEDSIKDHYKNKLADIREENARMRLEKLTGGYESMNREQLGELIEKLNGDEFPKHMTYGVIKKVTDALNNFDAREAAKAFENVDFATAAQLEAMKEIIAEERFGSDILAQYIPRVEQREKDLINEELDDMCAGADNMSQEELEKLKKDILASDKGFDERLVEKYLDRIAQRVCELKNSELAELCKYIFSMEQEELDKLKVTLADEKYDKEFTAVYYRKIEEREQELTLLELDKLCEKAAELDIPELDELKGKILDTPRYDGICAKYISLINDRIDAIKTADYRKVIDGVKDMSAEQVEEFRKNAEEMREEIGEELFRISMAAADEREDAIENEELEALCDGVDAFSFEKAESVLDELSNGAYPPEKTAVCIKKIQERISELHRAELDSFIDGIDLTNKEQLIKAQMKVRDYGNGCPDDLKNKYISVIDAAIADIADKEIRELCGNIETLSVKKSSDIIRRLNNMPIDDEARNRYIDVLDKHIASIREKESKDYIFYLAGRMDDAGVNAVHLSVPGVSNLFYSKYDDVCSRYVSPGRYELPILIHDGNAGDGFTLTTEYLYTCSRGVMNRVKLDNIASFQAKKSLMSSALTAVEKNGTVNDMPNVLNKAAENVAKVLTSLVSYIHDKRANERMKEMLETAVQEKAQEEAMAAQAAVTAAPPIQTEQSAEAVSGPAEKLPEENIQTAESVQNESAPAEEVKAKFCDQCGAKITSTTAKFCAECGNKLI